MSAMTAQRAVVAIGGNALILDGQQGTIAEQYENALEFTRLMGRITLARNPSYALPPLGFVGTPTGIDARRVVDSGIAPVINTGIAHRRAGVGQIGAGIARAPLAVFASAITALGATLGVPGSTGAAA